jgi:hypothetical protein
MMPIKYKTVNELVRQINRDDVQVLSRLSPSKRNTCDIALDLHLNRKNKITQRFIMKVMDAQFQSALWRHKELLQQLINCAIQCQECVFECAKAQGHAFPCVFCESSKRVSSSCFMLAKNLVESQAVSSQLLLQCVEACRNFVARVGEAQAIFSQHSIGECQRCAQGCMNLYKRLGMN